MKSHLSISIFLLLAIPVLAQKKSNEADTVKEKHSFIPTGIRVGTDVVSIIKSGTDNTFEGWEVSGDIDFYRYYFAVDYGYWARDFVAEESQYSNGGTYWRLGADVNFLTKDPDKNMFFIGLRYGHSVFSETLNLSKVDPIWGPINSTLHNSNVNGGWGELTTGIRVRMWKFIWLGYTARLKFGLSLSDTQQMLPSDVPGYGRADKDSYWGFNYLILIRLPVRKQPSALKQ